MDGPSPRQQAWRAVLRGWARPSRQHDVSEFLAFIMRGALPGPLQGHWLGLAEGDAQVVGMPTAPCLGLSLGRAPDLQGMGTPSGVLRYIHRGF